MQQLFHSKDKIVSRAGVRKAAQHSSRETPSYLHLADPRLGESLTFLPPGLVDEVRARQQETLVLGEAAVAEVHVEAHPRGRPERLTLVTYDAVGDHGVPSYGGGPAVNCMLEDVDCSLVAPERGKSQAARDTRPR